MNCGTSFDIYDKIGDSSSWITSFFLSVFLVPLIFLFEIYLSLSITQYILLLVPFIITCSILLLRITKFYFLYRYLEKKNENQ